ncbi:MAG: FRG domain-containing protein [Bacteroidales bacterium]|nr:FRG domain-containing protein [Bacteroidales bacterium]
MESIKKLKEQISPHASFPICQWVDVHTFEELQLKVAELSCLCKQYVLYFRGQSHDYPYKSGDTCLYPTIYRGKYTKDRWKELELASKLLMQKLSAKYPKKYFVSILNRKPMLQWSILQHYEVVPTPLIDVTQSLRVACSFALQENPPKEEYAYIYAVALPYVSHRIHTDSEEYMTVIRLLSIAPPFAKRPYFQDGFLVGEDVIQEKYFSKNELDLSRRLIAKFRIPTKNPGFWKGETKMDKETLLPKDDKMDDICKEVEKELEEIRAKKDSMKKINKVKTGKSNQVKDRLRSNSNNKEMEDTYTSNQIKRAAKMMLSEAPHYTNPQICKETRITISRISRWRRCWNILSFVLEPEKYNNPTLLAISIHTKGVGDEVRQDWIREIAARWGDLNGLTDPNRIRTILENISQTVNNGHPGSKNIDNDIIDIATAYLIDATRPEE